MRNELEKVKVKPTKDQLCEDLRQAIWPLYDDELFIKILNQNPDIMTFKSGPSQETLLHR